MITQIHDPGGKTLMPLPFWVKGGAVFGGPNHEYRYELIRVWGEMLPVVLFVMMNPSTGLDTADDPTVYRCRCYAEDWGFGTLLVGNTFAYRATNQKALLSVADPIGPQNDRHLAAMAEIASLIVFAYGQPHKSLRARGLAVARRLSRNGKRPVHVLELSQDGTPKHPLYLKGSLKPQLWRPRYADEKVA
jgi:hypothetical protein